MSSDPKQQEQQPENNQQGQEQQNQQGAQQPQQNQNTLTEEDKKVYTEIMGSLNRMNKKIKSAKQKAPTTDQVVNDTKRNTVNEIAQKLIQSKQNSDIITKQDLVTDVQQTFQQVVVNVYSQNQQMKNKIKSLVAIIKEQNKKLNQYKQKQEKLIQQNQKLRQELVKSKDNELIAGYQAAGKKKQLSNQQNKNVSNIKNKNNTYQNEDYDFWSMPNNQSSGGKKRKDFVADSGLWVNDKDIDKSVFITDQKGTKR